MAHSTKCGALLKKYEDIAPFTSEDVVSSFNARLSDLGLDDLTVDSASVEVDGTVSVVISNPSGDYMELGFMVRDGEEGQVPYVVTMGGQDGEDALEIDLSDSDVPIIDGGTGSYIDMNDLSWLTPDLASAIFGAADVIDDEPEVDIDITVDDENRDDDEWDDDDDFPMEKFIGIGKRNGKLYAEKANRNGEYLIRCRKARTAMKAKFEFLSGNTTQRRSSIKSRRR